MRLPLFAASVALLAFSFTASSPAGPAYAQPAENIVTTSVAYAGTDAEKLQALLTADLAEGWHTYWRTPGESGLAPVFDWSKSDNLGTVEVFYPAPERDTQFDIHTYVYHGQVPLPLKVTPKDASQPVHLQGSVTYMVCKDICVPETDTVDVTLAKDGIVESSITTTFNAALARVATADTVDAYALNSGVLGKAGLVVGVTGLKPDEKVETFVEHKNGYFLRPPVITREGDRMLLTFAGPADTDLVKEMAGQTVTVTLVIGEGDKAKLLTRTFTF